MDTQKHSDCPITILMIEDDPAFGKVIEYLVTSWINASFHFFTNIEEALEKLPQIQPTIILLDFFIPGSTGIENTQRIRNLSEGKRIPIIILSSNEDPEIKSQIFAAGANDYIVKPPEKTEFIARIRYHSEAYWHLIERDAAFTELLASKEELKKDIQDAGNYVRSLLPEKLDIPELKTNWTFQASKELGGDSLGYHWIDLDHFAIYLMDVSGHGVGSALLSVSLLNSVRTQSLPGVDFREPAQVLEALGKKYPVDEKHKLFFTIWYGVYSKKTKELIYSSGGHPPALLIRQIDSAPQSFPLSTPNAIIGLLQNLKYKQAKISIKPGDHLYIFSDGAFEIKRPDSKELITFHEFTKIIEEASQKPHSILDAIVGRCQEIQDQKHFEDDVSLIKVIFKG